MASPVALESAAHRVHFSPFSSSRAKCRVGRPRVRQVQCSAEPSLPAGKILVAGATGGVGKQVVQQLLEKDASVRALVRDSSKTSDLDSRVEKVVGDVYDYASVLSAAEGCEYIICATGCRPSLDPLGPFNVDFQGTLNLIEAAKQSEIKHFVLVTSLGTDNVLNPLNLFYGVLFWKKQAELQLQRSGLTYTIVRPGGLKDKLESGEEKGQVTMKKANSIESGRILRAQVAETCIAALALPSARNKVCEIVATSTAAPASATSMETFDALFESI